MDELNRQAKELQVHLDIEFKDIGLLAEALTHRSYLKNKHHLAIQHNERLEFFGDAVLKLIVSEYIYQKYDDYSEGELTKIRALFVADKTLGFLAKKLNLGDYMVFSAGELNTGGGQRVSNLANAFEALLAAIYLDQGYDHVRQFYISILEKYWDVIKTECLRIDYKTMLQEYMQREYKNLPQYRIDREEGPDHQKEFFIVVDLELDHDHKSFSGVANSKKEAEQIAAREALNFFECSVGLPV